jgi:hypothetical protein
MSARDLLLEYLGSASGGELRDLAAQILLAGADARVPEAKLGPQCFIVHDANGHALAYVYFEEEPGRRAAAKLLTRDEARRIAVNIAKCFFSEVKLDLARGAADRARYMMKDPGQALPATRRGRIAALSPKAARAAAAVERGRGQCEFSASD